MDDGKTRAQSSLVGREGRLLPCATQISADGRGGVIINQEHRGNSQDTMVAGRLVERVFPSGYAAVVKPGLGTGQSVSIPRHAWHVHKRDWSVPPQAGVGRLEREQAITRCNRLRG